MTSTPMSEKITIDGGVVTGATTTGAGGVITHHDQIGKYRFFVTYSDADGFEHELWDGQDYDGAINAAHRAQTVLGIVAPIVDIVGERAI